MKRLLMTLTIVLLFSLEGQADQNEAKDEDDYVKEWCATNAGQRDWPLDDDTKVDCLTDTYVVEFKRAGE